MGTPLDHIFFSIVKVEKKEWSLNILVYIVLRLISDSIYYNCIPNPDGWLVTSHSLGDSIKGTAFNFHICKGMESCPVRMETTFDNISPNSSQFNIISSGTQERHKYLFKPLSIFIILKTLHKLLYYFDQVFMSCVTSPNELNTCNIITGHSWF